MSYGLPMITTNNCRSIYQNHVHGIIVIDLSISALYQSIKFIHDTPDVIVTWSRNFINSAKLNKSSHYRDRVRKIINEIANR